LSYKTPSPRNVAFCAIKINYVGPNAVQQSNIYIGLLIEILGMLRVLIYANMLPTDELTLFEVTCFC